MKTQTLILAIIFTLIAISIPLSFLVGNIAPTFFTIYFTLAGAAFLFGNTENSNK